MKELVTKVKKTFFITLVAAFIGAVIVILYLFFGHKSDGYRGGTLIKISQKGIVFTTTEGQLNVGTFLDNGKDKPFSPIWDFSVKNDPVLFEKLNRAILSNHRVRLHYHENFVKLPWRGDTKYVVEEVEIVN